jgi:iron complex transport system ATP-binding protein
VAAHSTTPSYCDQVFVLDAGRVVASGSPEEVFIPDLLLRVFRVRAHCGTHPLTGRPLLAFAPTTPGPTPHRHHKEIP